MTKTPATLVMSGCWRSRKVPSTEAVAPRAVNTMAKPRTNSAPAPTTRRVLPVSPTAPPAHVGQVAGDQRPRAGGGDRQGAPREGHCEPGRPRRVDGGGDH